MDSEWKNRIFTCFGLLLLLAMVIFFVVTEQPSTRAFIIITSSYVIGLFLGQQFFQRLSLSPPVAPRQPSLLAARISGLITITVIICLQLFGGKRLAGDVVAGLLSAVCGVVTYTIGYYWCTRPR